jgi:hypothetical protein
LINKHLKFTISEQNSKKPWFFMVFDHKNQKPDFSFGEIMVFATPAANPSVSERKTPESANRPAGRD